MKKSLLLTKIILISAIITLVGINYQFKSQKEVPAFLLKNVEALANPEDNGTNSGATCYSKIHKSEGSVVILCGKPCTVWKNYTDDLLSWGKTCE